MIIMMLGNDHRNDDHFDSDDKDDEMEAHLPARRVLNEIQVDDHVSPLVWGETKRPGNIYIKRLQFVHSKILFAL